MFLTCLQVSRHGGAVCLAKVMGHEHRDRLVHHLGNGVAEGSFSGGVDEENGTLLVDGDDGVGSRFGDDAEKLGGLRELFVGKDRSGDFGFPGFRHSRLVACSLAQELCLRPQSKEGFQPAEAVDRDKCSIAIWNHVGGKEELAQLTNNRIAR